MFFIITFKSSGYLKFLNLSTFIVLINDRLFLLQFVIFKPLGHCFEKTRGFDVTALLQVVHYCV